MLRCVFGYLAAQLMKAAAKKKKELSGDELPQTKLFNLLLAQITTTLCHV